MNQIYLRSVVYNYKVQSIGVSAKGVGGGGEECETPNFWKPLARSE